MELEEKYLQGRELIPLFSTPLYTGKIKNIIADFTQIEWERRDSFFISKDRHILNSFEELKKEVESFINEYFYEILSVIPETKIYITESWLIKLETGDFSRFHKHTNSVLSGIIWLSKEGETGNFICQSRKHLNNFYFETSNDSFYSADYWTVIPEPGNIMIFPSYMEHAIDIYHGILPRYSLAFNTFVKGIICKRPTMSLTI